MSSGKNNHNYYLVAPAYPSYQAKEFLAYSSNLRLKKGQVVKITIKNKPTLGVVIGLTEKPSFTAQVAERISGVILPEANADLMIWMNEYYPGGLGPIVQHFVPSFVSNLPHEGATEDSTSIRTYPQLPPLTSEQKKVVTEIKNSDRRTFFLHGETGSGKTRVYIELAKSCLETGKSVLVLVPEISLTAPMAKSLGDVFGEEKVMCVHSNLTQTKRKKAWSDLFKIKQATVIVGPRSAVFYPISRLGLIVVDESHDNSYKQESSPYYHANRLASKLAGFTGSKLIFGSGTPSVSEYFLAQAKNIPILRMKKQAIKSKHDPKPLLLIDMTRQEERSAHPLLSKTLTKEIGANLKQNSQILLFLNKRGSAKSILCQSCGWRKLCPNCDSSLTYHQDRHFLACHICGHREQPPVTCPECGSEDIIFKNPGTKAIALALEKLFPGIKVARFDRDNTKSERIEQNYDKLVSGEVQIIVGTQMLTKGHDLPRLGLAAVLSADSGLDFPDYTSEDLSYQLISQLKGRINRGHRPGQLIIQTYKPDTSVLKYVLSGDWDQFYKDQISHRKKLNFPPFVHALKVETARASKASAQQSINKVAKSIEGKPGINIIGPAPCYMEKRAGKFHWQIVLTSKKRDVLVGLANDFYRSYKTELDPSHFL